MRVLIDLLDQPDLMSRSAATAQIVTFAFGAAENDVRSMAPSSLLAFWDGLSMPSWLSEGHIWFGGSAGDGYSGTCVFRYLDMMCSGG
jgi:hypothetical protein